MTWFQRYKVAGEGFPYFCSGWCLKDLIAFFLKHIYYVIRHLSCMHKNFIVAQRIHQAIYMYVAVRLLHMPNFNSHSLKLCFDLLISAFITTTSGRYNTSMSVHPHCISSFKHAIACNCLNNRNSYLAESLPYVTLLSSSCCHSRSGENGSFRSHQYQISAKNGIRSIFSLIFNIINIYAEIFINFYNIIVLFSHELYIYRFI